MRVCRSRTTITILGGVFPSIGAHTRHYVAFRLLFYYTYLCVTFLYIHLCFDAQHYPLVSCCSFVAKKILIAFLHTLLPSSQEQFSFKFTQSHTHTPQSHHLNDRGEARSKLITFAHQALITFNFAFPFSVNRVAREWVKFK